MTSRTKDDTVSRAFKTQKLAETKFEVWVLGTWIPGTGEATVVYSGTEKACLAFRNESPIKATLAVRASHDSIDSNGNVIVKPLIEVFEEIEN